MSAANVGGKRCATCGARGERGECRRHAPEPVTVAAIGIVRARLKGELMRAVWPTTADDDVCAEWIARTGGTGSLVAVVATGDAGAVVSPVVVSKPNDVARRAF